MNKILKKAKIYRMKAIVKIAKEKLKKHLNRLMIKWMSI